MEPQISDVTRRSEMAIPLVIKISLCLWMSLVMITFLLLFMPSEHLSILDRFDTSQRLLSLRLWMQPFFEDPNSKYFPP